MLRPSPHPLLALQLFDAFRWFRDGLLETLGEAGWSGMGETRALILAHVDEGGTRASELARRVHVSRQAAHGHTRQLLAEGLVELRPDPSNRSARRVTLTDRGEDVARTIRHILQGLEEELGERIGDPALQGLEDALDRSWGPPYDPRVEEEARATRPRSAGWRRSRSWP